MKSAIRLTVRAASAVVLSVVHAQTLTTLHSFTATDGQYPSALVQGVDGNLFGTMNKGGANGYGAVFKISRGGTFTTLYNFCSQLGCSDGEYPNSALVLSNGELYGTTTAGGANGLGTIFRITPNGALTTIYTFCSAGGCVGVAPYGALMRATSGELIGTTGHGGAYAYGAVFQLTPGATPTALYSFCAGIQCPDGAYPYAGLIQATDGGFYGTTYGGGDIVCYQGCGTIFKLTPSGKLTTLYSFPCEASSCADGENPFASLVQATDGNFYGTSYWGGSNQNGTAFRVTPSGAFTLLYSFCSINACTDGDHPAGLIQGTDGNLYGTTLFFGNSDGGTIFKMTTGGALTTLYSFCSQSGCPDGKNASVALVQDTDGNFYGTTSAGGASGNGTVFKLSTGLGPFVQAVPAMAAVGASIDILGTNLTGATAVSFNGAAAAFTVESIFLITAVVPAGATSGFVTVTTSNNKKLTSNVKFQVRP